MSTLPKVNPLLILADIAHTQVGVHEEGGENRGPQVQQYQAATDEPGTGWPWCAAFVCWCVAQLAKQRPGLLSCEMRKCLPREAGVEGLTDWAMRTGQLIFTPSTEIYRPQGGDLVCYYFPTGRHCGIVTGYDPAAKKIATVEGNTSGPYQARQSERNGGEVALKSRLLGAVTYFIRLSLHGKQNA